MISQRLRQFPAVAIIGPRQAGKTTLAKLFSAGYYDLEQQGDRVKLDLRWNEIVAKNELVVLDEAQSWPEIFPRLRGAIDARRGVKGRFLLLGLASTKDLREQPWVGASWEGWVIEQILAVRRARGENIREHYFRTNDGLECDLLLETDAGIEVIEIKLGSNPPKDVFAKLGKIAALVNAKRQVVISRIPDSEVVESCDRWSTNIHNYLAKITGTSIPGNSPVDAMAINQPNLFGLLQEEAGGLVREKVLTSDTLARRAAWLAEDLKMISIEGFELLPPRWVSPPGSDLLFRIVEYKFSNTARSMDTVTDPFQVAKDVANMEGSGLDRSSLLYLSKISEIGHRIIPNLWLKDETLRKNLELGTQHLNTLNEVWWLSKWHGIDPGSVEHEKVVLKGVKDSRRKPAPRVDWSFTVLGGQVRINLEVKRRDGAIASAVYSKDIHLFNGNPEKPFSPSGADEINVLAITSYHGGHITEREERRAD